jgi:hypothetical protein
MADDLVTWLRDELDRVEQLARATTVYQPYDEWTPVGVEDDRDTARSCWEVALIARPAVRSPSARSLMEHIAAHDPATVLRRVAADRQILEEHRANEVYLDDRDLGCFTYLTTLCRCCVNAVGYPCPTIRLLAKGYGWTGPQFTGCLAFLADHQSTR